VGGWGRRRERERRGEEEERYYLRPERLVDIPYQSIFLNIPTFASGNTESAPRRLLSEAECQVRLR